MTIPPIDTVQTVLALIALPPEDTEARERLLIDVTSEHSRKGQAAFALGLAYTLLQGIDILLLAHPDATRDGFRAGLQSYLATPPDLEPQPNIPTGGEAGRMIMDVLHSCSTPELDALRRMMATMREKAVEHGDLQLAELFNVLALAADTLFTRRDDTPSPESTDV